MSFAKRILEKTLPLPSFENFPVEGKLPVQTVLINGVSLEIAIKAPLKIHWREKLGHLSLVEKKILDHFAELTQKQSKIPDLREFDFYLRDNPLNPPWPEHFNTVFLETIRQNLMQMTKPSVNLALTPKTWLQNKLQDVRFSTIELIEVDQNRIILQGSQADAWSLEKELLNWQNELREIFEIPNLLLLYSIKI